MPYDSWICLAVARGPGMLSDGVRMTLKRTACRMHRQRFDRLLISDDFCSGVMETKWDSQLVGTRGGILFKAKLDDNAGGFFQVNFLYSIDDLERGAQHLDELEGDGPWFGGLGTFPIPALNEFDDEDELHTLH